MPGSFNQHAFMIVKIQNNVTGSNYFLLFVTNVKFGTYLKLFVKIDENLPQYREK
jgi:hypothetical protein